MELGKLLKQLPRFRQRQNLCSFFSFPSTHILPAVLPCAATSLSVAQVRLLKQVTEHEVLEWYKL